MSIDEDRKVEMSGDLLDSFMKQVEQLEVAVDHRTVIGQAQGILMVQLNIDAAAAFEYLKRVSSRTNTKLIDIADQIAETRALPEIKR